MRDFTSIHAAAALESDEPEKNVTPGAWASYAPRRTTHGAVEQIRELQAAARVRAARSSTLAQRYLFAGLGLVGVGAFTWWPLWLAGVLLATRGVFCWEDAIANRREAAYDPIEFLVGLE